MASVGLFGRLGNLWRGFVSLWISDESANELPLRLTGTDEPEEEKSTRPTSSIWHFGCSLKPRNLTGEDVF